MRLSLSRSESRREMRSLIGKPIVVGPTAGSGSSFGSPGPPQRSFNRSTRNFRVASVCCYDLSSFVQESRWPRSKFLFVVWKTGRDNSRRFFCLWSRWRMIWSRFVFEVAILWSIGLTRRDMPRSRERSPREDRIPNRTQLIRIFVSPTR